MLGLVTNKNQFSTQIQTWLVLTIRVIPLDKMQRVLLELELKVEDPMSQKVQVE